MDRRHFLQTSAALTAVSVAHAKSDMPMATLGKSGLKVSRFTLGGYHMAVKGKEEAIKIIHRALDLGVVMFDSAAKYHNGGSDEIYGEAISPAVRKKILLMSKAEKRTKAEAMAQLEMTLKRMKTDYLDLWQCHEVVRMDEVERIFGPGGSLEAFVEAKRKGMVRHIGFTGHADPDVHLALLKGFDGWETVQHPVNCIDPHYLSFIKNVLPKVRQKGWGLLGMKSNGIGALTKNSIATIDECLRFAWTQDIDTLVSGVETVQQLEHNVGVCKAFTKMSPEEISSLLERTSKGPFGSKIESYKKAENSARHGAPAHRDGEAD